LDTMGRQGETMWPNDWSLVQDAAKEIPHRLHLDGGKKPKVEYEIVPKSILKSPKGEDDDEENDKAAEIVSRTSGHVTFHLERKKRKAQEGEAGRATQKPRRKEEHKEKPREPSTMEAETVWDWEVTKMTVEDKGQLEAKYIHPDNKPTPNHILLGAIKHLGRSHFFLQNEVTEDESDETKRKRALRKAFKERLGPLQMMRDERDANKLLTKMRRAYHSSDQQIWSECDLGECMLEIESKDSNSDKKLFAFSSIELSLRDEDD